MTRRVRSVRLAAILPALLFPLAFGAVGLSAGCVGEPEEGEIENLEERTEEDAAEYAASRNAADAADAAR